jgi:hypothetical protein
MTDKVPEATESLESPEVRRVLERGFGTEPPVRLTRDDLIVRGKRRQRRQRNAAIAGVALAAVAVLTVASVATSDWFGATQTGPAASHGPTTTVTTKPLSPKERLSEALRTAPIKWPDEITRRTNDPGPHWYDFRYGFVASADSTGYEASIKLETATGYRWLTIDVLSVPAGTHAPDCIGAQSKQPLPDCTRTGLPDGGEMRVDVEQPADARYPAIVLVTVVRPGHTKVEVMETSSVGNGARSDQVLSTSALTEIAQLPGFTLG